MEKPMYRDNLERVLSVFGDGECIPLKKAAAWLGIEDYNLKKDRNFPLKQIGGRYYVTAVGLARYLS